MENPWNIQSLFELQFFVCPSCAYKNNSKQEFVYHAYNIHPESIEKLKFINDDSISDVNCPWNEVEIKEKMVLEQNDLEDNSQNGEMLDIRDDPELFDETDNNFQSEEDSIESNVEKHRCNHCEKNFYSKQTLQRHKLAVHDGLKPYKCEQCEKSFSLKKALDVHLKSSRIHEGIKKVVIGKSKNIN